MLPARHRRRYGTTDQVCRPSLRLWTQPAIESTWSHNDPMDDAAVWLDRLPTAQCTATTAPAVSRLERADDVQGLQLAALWNVATPIGCPTLTSRSGSGSSTSRTQSVRFRQALDPSATWWTCYLLAKLSPAPVLRQYRDRTQVDLTVGWRPLSTCPAALCSMTPKAQSI